MLHKTYFLLLTLTLPLGAEPIDREALVTRHSPHITRIDPDAPVTVGNGGFAFSADITGLQTFADLYHREGVPTETLCRWAWYSEPNPQHYSLADASKPFTHPDGRIVSYPTDSESPAGQWLRRNPRNHPLGQIAFVRPDGTAITPAEIHEPKQTLDLWRGEIRSRFTLDSEPVDVVTVCHPQQDSIATRVESPLLASGKLAISIAFPRGHDIDVKNTPALDWSEPSSHSSTPSRPSDQRADILRKRDTLTYHASITWQEHATFAEKSQHHFTLTSTDPSLTFSVTFSPTPISKPTPDFATTRKASADHWADFWQRSAAVDFSGSTDPRADRIEERIILSRFLMARQCAGDFPPQESGLTCSTWYGKHHTEMIWWHTAHFALWGNDALLAKNLDWFRDHLPEARALAKSRDIKGARWPKMIGPDCRESPGGNPLILWNQPHPIYLAELLYRNTPTEQTLGKYRELVLESADCLASMLYFDKAQNLYHLGPPLWIAQEIHDQATSQDPSFELAYWHWALTTAQLWHERLGMPRDAKWDHILAHLPPLPTRHGKYVALASHPDTWDNIDSRHDHPTMLAPLGILPGGPMVDRDTMDRTLDAVLKTWDWETKIWGWDYPMIAMTATRLGHPETAIDILLRDGPNNRYLPTGHCPQRSDEALPKNPPAGARKREIAAYLPANGSFLTAVALMVAGCDGCETTHPGFPKNGQWKIRAEGIKPMP